MLQQQSQVTKCAIENCGAKRFAKGLCKQHYMLLWRYGSTDPHVRKVKRNIKHGCYGNDIYGIWIKMMGRCYNVNDGAYKNYGARGITVCDAWHDPRVFISDMSPRPAGASIDRIDNSQGYSKANCRWASDTQQARNRRGVKLTIELAERMRAEPRRGRNGRGPGMSREDLAEKYGVSVATVKKVLSGAYWKK